MAWRASINVECADDTVLGCFTAATPHVSFLLSGVQVCSNVGHCSFLAAGCSACPWAVVLLRGAGREQQVGRVLGFG